MAEKAPAIRLGLSCNAAQFGLLVGVNALVGGMLGQERTVMPLLAERTFGVAAYASILTYIVAFGLTKAATNLVAGALSDRWGRKPVLVAGWIVALPVPVMLIWAPSWGWVVAANVLLGVNQGLTWSTTVIMKVDLAGPERRGLALGLNEASGYGAVALTAWVTGLIAEQHGLRPGPFLLGLAYAALGLGLSSVFVRETIGHARLEAAGREIVERLRLRSVFGLTTLRERALSAACQAGLVNNAIDGLAWGLFPLLFARRGLSTAAIGALVATYPAVWSLGQLVTGALSDRWGRKGLIVAGMLTQAGALVAVATASSFWAWLAASAAIGAGTAMVYPTLLAVVGDVAHPSWRASAVGVYRLWRDIGFAVGAGFGGVLADAVSLRSAIWAMGA
ncbi:MAG: MFS transporter, partial [Acidimicrobiales bacterium]